MILHAYKQENYEKPYLESKLKTFIESNICQNIKCLNYIVFDTNLKSIMGKLKFVMYFRYLLRNIIKSKTIIYSYAELYE